MGTTADENISSTLFGKTRRGLLALLFTRTDRSFFLRQIARITGLGVGAVQRELKKLTRAGIVRRSRDGNQVYFQANEDSPVFNEIKNLILKTVGLLEVLRTALAPLENSIKAAFVYGSVASGRETGGSDVDILVIGDVSLVELVECLSSAQKSIGREINPSVFPVDEFRKKAAANNHFLSAVLKGKKFFVIGDENELSRLGG